MINGWKVIVLRVGENKFLWIFYFYTCREYNTVIIIIVIQNCLYRFGTSFVQIVRATNQLQIQFSHFGKKALVSYLLTYTHFE